MLFHVCFLHPCSVFLDVYSVLRLFYLTSCVCVCHFSHGPFAGVPSSQALPGFLITAPPPVFVPAVLGVLAVWIQNPKKKGKNSLSGGPGFTSSLGRKAK